MLSNDKIFIRERKCSYVYDVGFDVPVDEIWADDFEVRCIVNKFFLLRLCLEIESDQTDIEAIVFNKSIIIFGHLLVICTFRINKFVWNIVDLYYNFMFIIKRQKCGCDHEKFSINAFVSDQVLWPYHCPSAEIFCLSFARLFFSDSLCSRTGRDDTLSSCEGYVFLLGTLFYMVL